MQNDAALDVDFDFRCDTPKAKDPDSHSPTLRRYHKFLWSKPLPSGAVLELLDNTRGVYLHHRSALGEFWLASDSVVPDFKRERRVSAFTEEVGTDLNVLARVSYTIGGMMLFPGNRIGRQMTINGARGFHPRIKDRFDLTVECIRRHYLGQWSPLAGPLERYDAWFRLFSDFKGYVDFFRSLPVPDTAERYLAYAKCAIGFLRARNERIRAWAEAHSGD